MACLRFRPQLLTLFAVVVSPMVMFFYAFYTEFQDNFCHAISRSDENLGAISYYCNFIDIPVTGSEGDVQLAGLNLEQVQIIIRHGDRAGMHNLPNYNRPQLSCRLSNYPHIFPQLSTSLPHTLQVEKLDKVLDNIARLQYLPESLRNFNLYPMQDFCDQGQLTPTGVAQHLKNGAFLYDRYQKWNLFSNLNDSVVHKPIKLITTNSERTLQSGIALMYGLLPAFNLSQIEVQTAVNQSMCSLESRRIRYSCYCKAVKDHHAFTSQTYGLTYSSGKKEKYYEQIAAAFDLKLEEVPSTQSLLDTGMIHMCHRLPLPGSPGKCMEISSLRHLLEEANQYGRSESQQGFFPTVAKMRMLPLIDQIRTSMVDLTSNTVAHKIILYSGHDTTLDPLLVALSISTGEWPMYAARIVVELYSYEKKESPAKSFFFRILYNGKDRTADAIKCKEFMKFGLCPLNVLEEYIDTSVTSALCEGSLDKR